MTDDLVKRLDVEINATYGKYPCGILSEAKDRIEALVADLKKEKDKVDRLLRSHLFIEKILYAVLAKEEKDGCSFRAAAQKFI